MTVASKITLREWARRSYGEAAPCDTTLRRWANSGRIQPKPEIHGRAYFVEPSATYKPANGSGK